MHGKESNSARKEHSQSKEEDEFTNRNDFHDDDEEKVHAKKQEAVSTGDSQHSTAAGSDKADVLHEFAKHDEVYCGPSLTEPRGNRNISTASTSSSLSSPPSPTAITPTPTIMIRCANMTPTVTVGAQRISGIYGRENSATSSATTADFDEYDTESQVAVAATASSSTPWDAQVSLVSPLSASSSMSTSSSTSYLVEATTVPELVSARAILMPSITEDDDNKDTVGNDNNSIMKRNYYLCRRRRGLLLAIGILVVVVVALALGVVLAKILPKSHTTTTDNQNTIHHNVTNNSTRNDSPTYAPTAASNNNAQGFLTTLNADRCDFGYMFDITAKTDLELLSLQININAKTSQHLEVWTKQGPYHGFETNQSAWTLLGQRNVTPTHMSNNNLVSLPRNLFPPQNIPKGSRQALYVTAQASVICFEVSLKSLVGGTYESVAFNTTDFELHVGTGVTYRFGEFGLPSILSGILEYVQTNA